MTGTCAVLVDPTGERSLVTNLAAANHFKATHLADAAQASVIEKAKYYYMAGELRGVAWQQQTQETTTIF